MFRLMGVSVLAVWLAQPVHQIAPQEMAADRLEDAYTVYAAALHNSIWDHRDNAETYFLAGHTGQTYEIGGPERCIQPPAEDKDKLQQAAGDFLAQSGKAYRLENKFNFTERKVRMLTAGEETEVGDKLFYRTTLSDPTLNAASDLIYLGNIGFSHDRLLAIVVVSNYCGGRCGGERWRIFKREKHQWAEQNWNSCVVIS